MPPNSRPHEPKRLSSAQQSEVFLEAALSIVGEGGLKALTLRPLAARVGFSVPTLTHHLGSKERILERLIAHAHAQDVAFHGPWLRRAAQLERLDLTGRAALGEAAFRSWIETARPRAILLCAVVQTRLQHDGVVPALAAWFDAWETFWRELAANDARGAALLAYFVDEAVYSLALGGLDAYGLLRRLCLTQLFTSLDAGAPARKPSLRLFASARDELAPPHSVVDQTMIVPAVKRVDIARHAAALIVSDGVESISHRSVAAAAGVPASTVVYQFGSRDELLLAALEEVIHHFRAWRAKAGPEERDGPPSIRASRPLLRATTAIAFESVWRPTLAPHAADMRRRRGENITADSAPRLSAAVLAQFDPLAAQVYSICMFGARMRAMALDEDEAAANDLIHDALNEVG
jgi:AcrR family transcriptional regulator